MGYKKARYFAYFHQILIVIAALNVVIAFKTVNDSSNSEQELRTKTRAKIECGDSISLTYLINYILPQAILG